MAEKPQWWRFTGDGILVCFGYGTHKQAANYALVIGHMMNGGIAEVSWNPVGWTATMLIAREADPTIEMLTLADVPHWSTMR